MGFANLSTANRTIFSTFVFLIVFELLSLITNRKLIRNATICNYSIFVAWTAGAIASVSSRNKQRRLFVHRVPSNGFLFLFEKKRGKIGQRNAFATSPNFSFLTNFDEGSRSGGRGRPGRLSTGHMGWSG